MTVNEEGKRKSKKLLQKEKSGNEKKDKMLLKIDSLSRFLICDEKMRRENLKKMSHNCDDMQFFVIP
jgi:archaellum biogenesis ATPase FlaH